MGLICGIDEAGRGALVGPLVIAGVAIDEELRSRLKELGVKDSKELLPSQREALKSHIEQLSHHVLVLKVQAWELDMLREKGYSLDHIEARKFAEIINTLKPEKAYLDAPGNVQKFKTLVSSYLDKQLKVELIAEHKADKHYEVVSAASIIAKVERDKAIKRLEEKSSMKIGTGYSHDSSALEFVKHCLKHKVFLSEIRRSWITAQEMTKELSQKKLSHFL